MQARPAKFAAPTISPATTGRFAPCLTASPCACSATTEKNTRTAWSEPSNLCLLSTPTKRARPRSHGTSVRLFCNNRKEHADGVVGTEQPLFALDANDAHSIGII